MTCFSCPAFQLVLDDRLVLPLAQAVTMTKPGYNSGKTRISTDYKAGKATCSGQAGNATPSGLNKPRSGKRLRAPSRNMPIADLAFSVALVFDRFKAFLGTARA